VIPTLIVPVLNRPELLTTMIDSIDYPIAHMVVIDNGGVVGDLPANIDVIRLPHNIGCGAAWNLGFKVTPQSDWWLVVNSDIEFTDGDLKRIASAVDPEKAAVYHMLGFAAFAITPGALVRVGLFDENFHPAYCEDIDYSRRAELAGVPRINVEAHLKHVGSATIYGEQRYMRQNGLTYPANLAYYEAKWGGKMHGGETFSTPFDGGGSVADLRVDIRRLRTLAWQRAGV
jgi:GT2 family glycosyltransferase